MADGITLPSDQDVTLPSDRPIGPEVGGSRAAWEGFKSGVTAGWSDKISGALAAMPTAGTDVDAGAMAFMTPEQHQERIKAVGEQAQKAEAETRMMREAAQRQHPYLFGAGELGGAALGMAAVPGGGLAEGATLLPRLGQAARIGAGYGALSGAAEGEREGGLLGAGIGVLGGGLMGAAGGAGGELVGTGLGALGRAAYDRYGRPIVGAVRGLLSPKEAEMRAAGALLRDFPQVTSGKALGLTPEEFAAARAAGEPTVVADMGGETTRALLRSAANSSPEARAELQSLAQERFATQADRAGSTIRGLMSGGVDLAKTKAQLEAEYDAERVGAYGRAYEAGDRPIWSPELERLTSAPSIQSALRGAINDWKDWQVRDGFGAMNPPVRVTPDGQLKFIGGQGLMPYPNIQLWDYAQRNISGLARAAGRAGNDSEASRLGGLAAQLRSALDKEVPEFGEARGVAANYFGGNNAIEAGQKAVNFKGDIRDLRRSVAELRPAERGIFQEAYLDGWAKKFENMPVSSDVTRPLLPPATMQRIEAVAGPEAASRLGAFVDRERVYDALRKALGNSTTARQIIEAGLAGGAAGAGLAEIMGRNPIEGFIGGAGTLGFKSAVPKLASVGFKSALGYVDRNTAKRVAELLTSSDAEPIMRGLREASKNARIGQALRDTANRLVSTVGTSRAPKLVPQIPGVGAAQQDQDSIPGPVQRKDGGRVIGQQRKPFHLPPNARFNPRDKQYYLPGKRPGQ